MRCPAYFYKILFHRLYDIIGRSCCVNGSTKQNSQWSFPFMFSLNSLKIKRIAVFEPIISCVRDRDNTTVPQRHR